MSRIRVQDVLIDDGDQVYEDLMDELTEVNVGKKIHKSFRGETASVRHKTFKARRPTARPSDED